MSDYQDWCEWLNVSSGTGSPRVVPDRGPLNSRVFVLFIDETIYCGPVLLQSDPLTWKALEALQLCAV